MPALHLDTGNTGFMLLCSSLVMLMTPGLAFFYGGLVGRKNVLAIMIQSFVSMGWTTVLWWLCGFSLCFSGDLKSGTDHFGIIGNFDWAFLRGITLEPAVPERHDPDDRLLRLPDDVRDHHAGAHHRRVHEPRHVQGLHALPDGLAALRLLPVRPHGLGRRDPREVGRPRLRRRHRRPQHRRHRRARLGPLRRQAEGRRPRAAQHPARRPRHRPALVRLVRLQRRQRVPGRLRHRRRVPQHRHRRLLRGHRVARHGLDDLEEAEVPRPPHRRRRRPRDDHARRPATSRRRPPASSASSPASSASTRWP